MADKFALLWDSVLEEQNGLIVSLAEHCAFGSQVLRLKGETPEHYVKVHLYKAVSSFMNAASFQLLIKKEAVGKYRAFWSQSFPEAGNATLATRFLNAFNGLDAYNGRMPVDDYERLDWRIRLRQQFLSAVLAYIVGLEATMKAAR